jgi:hypothetical protein
MPFVEPYSGFKTGIELDDSNIGQVPQGVELVAGNKCELFQILGSANTSAFISIEGRSSV